MNDNHDSGGSNLQKCETRELAIQEERGSSVVCAGIDDDKYSDEPVMAVHAGFSAPHPVARAPDSAAQTSGLSCQGSAS